MTESEDDGQRALEPGGVSDCARYLDNRARVRTLWVARRCGVRVERFSIGFGRALWRRTDRQGTEYVIALIPLGGYVKMLDERVESVAPEMRHQAFNNKTVWQRAAIISAGPIANFLFAILPTGWCSSSACRVSAR